MKKYLMILEVSRKQDYIFGRKELRENIRRSIEIAHVTDSAFFRKAAGDDYSGEQNMVYSGGGHTVLQFEDREQARRFARKVTEQAMRDYGGMEIFVKIQEYDHGKTPGENLKELSAALERKKALRLSSFRTTGLGVEKLSDYFAPVSVRERSDLGGRQDILDPPKGYAFPGDFQLVAGEDNFLAVVYIDGNAMGERVNKIYQLEACRDWDTCAAALRSFSGGIQRDFEAAFMEMVDALPKTPGETVLPLRPIILAGDDVCFVTRGRLGLECARLFLEKLCVKRNREQPEDPYAACAGVAMVHTKYPFHHAYTLSEELCSSAKRFGASLDERGRISAMDWYIEFGQLRGDLEAIREDYIAQDGSLLTLRPVAVHSPGGIPVRKERTYGFFREMCQKKITGAEVGRNVWKGLRTALRRGRTESLFYIRWKKLPLKDAFFGEEQRCLYFDAIELNDHVTFFPEEESQ